LGSPYPIPELKITQEFQVSEKVHTIIPRLLAGVHDYIKVPPFGSFEYNFFAGKTFGTYLILFLKLLQAMS
jgi:hypothetical protein